MDLNLLLLIPFLAFQQVFNIHLFVTIKRFFYLLTMVIYTFETIGYLANMLYK